MPAPPATSSSAAGRTSCAPASTASGPASGSSTRRCSARWSSRATGHATAPALARLSEREQEVLRRTADGATSKEIAAALGLRPKTVENHRARILAKLGVANAAAAVRVALARGLVPALGPGAAPAAAAW